MGSNLANFICDECLTISERLAALEHDRNFEVVAADDGRLFDKRRTGR